MSESSLLKSLLQSLGESCKAGQRPLLWLSGTASQGYATWTSLSTELICVLKEAGTLQGSDTVNIAWISRAFGKLDHLPADVHQVMVDNGVVFPGHRSHVLGIQTDCLVFDAHEGFDPDLFCLASGTLKSGGALVLLAPPPEQWSSIPDPDYKRMLVYPFGLEDVICRFTRRVADRFLRHDIVCVWDCHEQRTIKAIGEDLPRSYPGISGEDSIIYNDEQREVIAAVRQSLTLHRKPEPFKQPLVITADRGRGKSAALGAAIAALYDDTEQLTVWLTAPNKDNVGVLLEHCRAGLGSVNSVMDDGSVTTAGFSVIYLAPDEVVHRLAPEGNENISCNLLIVDEAAAIPEPLLSRYAMAAPCCVFSSTVHGYEGTGRGFEIRFQPYLERVHPGWRLINLTHPIRWGDADLLESLLNRTFLLDAEPADVAHMANDVSPDFCEITQDELMQNPALLESVFGLLMQAHYRTCPGDLRDLMDGLNLRLFVMRSGNDIFACCLVAMEGPLSDELNQQVYQGKRRPRGHLLPQTLCQGLGYDVFGTIASARVVRIAVVPGLRRQKLGSRLLSQVERAISHEGVALFGSSFSAYPDVIDFWTQNGYAPVRLGFTREASSGSHALLVIKPMEGQLEDETCALTSQFAAAFQYLQSCEFRDLSDDLIAAIHRSVAAVGTASIEINPVLLRRQVRDFSEGFRTFEDSRFSLWSYLNSVGDAKAASLDTRLSEVLRLVFVEGLKPSDLNDTPLKLGKRQVTALMREAFQRLLSAEPLS